MKMANKLFSLIVERQHADDGEWTEHWLQAWAATPYTRTTGGTAEGKCACEILQLVGYLWLSIYQTYGPDYCEESLKGDHSSFRGSY